MTTLPWYRCADCGRRIEVPEGMEGTVDCPTCSLPATEARHRMVQLEAMLEELTSVSQREMADAQRVILEQQTGIADLRIQLTHALADPAGQPDTAPTDSPGIPGSGI